MAEELNFDDIDLDADGADEAAKLLETVEEEAVEVEETEEDATEEEEAPAGEAEEPKDPDPQEELKNLFEELRAERQRLQEQLNELAVTSLTDRKKLTQLEKNLKKVKAQPAAEKEPEDLNPQQVMGLVDRRIAQVDAALAQAEAEDPAAVPALRKQLRNLERMANDYRTQVFIQANKGGDPQVLVQQALLEADQRARFDMALNYVTSQYPILDPNSDYYDEKFAGQVQRVYTPMSKEGEDPAEALLESVSLVTAARGVLSIAQLQELQAQEEAKKAEEAKKVPPKKEGAAQRKTDAVKRNVAAAQAQPPNIANLGSPNSNTKLLDKYDLSTMPINEFLRLSDEEMDRLEAAALSLYE